LSRAGNAPAVAQAARAHRLSVTVGLPQLCSAPIRRGHHRDAGSDPTPVEGNPAHAREVLVSILRRNQPTAGAASSDCARARRGGPARTNSFLQIWFSPAAQPPERGPCSRGHRSRCLNAGRFGRRGCGDAARCLDPQASVCGRAHPISPFRSLLGQRPGPEDYGPMCATTDPVRSRPASCRLLLLA
jgi:hypothetical protein